MSVAVLDSLSPLEIRFQSTNQREVEEGERKEGRRMKREGGRDGGSRGGDRENG